MKKETFTSVLAIILYLAAIKIIFHMILPEYGYFRDEYYYMSIVDQFSFSNLDMLPLSPLYLKLLTSLFGYSIKTVHLASSLLGAASLVFTCLMTRELGGKKYAIALVGVLFLFSGFVPFGSIFTYDSIDFLITVAVLYLLVKILNEDRQQLWRKN
jgi:4-amino-4-deoxy-L-arabinose transferase-like glycosyltransferase